MRLHEVRKFDVSIIVCDVYVFRCHLLVSYLLLDVDVDGSWIMYVTCLLTLHSHMSKLISML